MSELFLKVFNMSVSACWLTLAVLVLRLVLKKAPKWSHVLLWGIVGIRLVCPFTVESVLSLIPSAETLAPEMLYSPSPTVHTGIASINSAVNPVFTQSFAPQDYASANPLQIWTAAGAVIWIIGLSGMLLYAFLSWLRVKTRVRTAVLLEKNVYRSEFVPSPFVLGVFRPRIYVPAQLDGQTLSHVLAHERAHIRRKDHWWKPLGFLLLSLHWFNPLMWLAYVLLCRDIELACDEAVVKTLDHPGKADYSQALLTCSVSRSAIAACPLAFGEVNVKNRVKSVLHYKKPAFWIIVTAVAACIVCAVCFLTNPPDDSSQAVPLFGTSYQVGDVVYQSKYSLETGFYSTVDPMEIRQITLQDDQTLLLRRSSQSEPEAFGKLEKTTLKRQNFDNYFDDDALSAQLRRRTKEAYVCIRHEENGESRMCYVLEAVTGEKYLVYGWWDAEGLTDPFSDDSSVYWVVKLTEYTPDLSRPAENGHKSLTLEEVLRLSKAGYELSWSDFEDYTHVDTGSGLYIWYFEIDEMFYLLIGGPSPETTPMYMRLCARDGLEDFADIRHGYVQEFIDNHKNNPLVTECNWNFYASSVGYSQSAFQTMLELGGIPKNAILNSVESLPVVRIENTQALQQFIEAAEDHLDLKQTQTQMDLSFLQLSELWDETFFERRTLFLCYTTTPMLGYDYTLQYARVSGDTLCIGVIEYEPEAGDTALGGYLLAVSIPNEEVETVKTVDARISAAEPMGGTDMADVVGYYVFRDSEEMMKPAVTLFDDGWFSFTFSMFSSYIGVGKYEIKDQQLTLRTNDGKFVYVFDMKDNKLVFDDKASSDMVWFSDIRDGSVFE